MTQVIDFIGGEYRNRTGVHGFAIRCVTTPPTRRPVVFAAYPIPVAAARCMIGESMSLAVADPCAMWHIIGIRI